MHDTAATVAPAKTAPGSGLPPGAATPLSFEALVEGNADFVFRSLRRAGLDAAGAEDASQQVFLIASRKLASIQLGREKSFLYATAMNVARQSRRSVARRAEVQYSEGADDPLASEADPSLDELLDQRRARELLDHVLLQLPEKLRHVFVLSELEELSAPEVAACLEIPVGTVASRLLRARDLFDVTLSRVQKRRSFGREKT